MIEPIEDRHNTPVVDSNTSTCLELGRGAGA